MDKYIGEYRVIDKDGNEQWHEVEVEATDKKEAEERVEAYINFMHPRYRHLYRLRVKRS